MSKTAARFIRRAAEMLDSAVQLGGGEEFAEELDRIEERLDEIAAALSDPGPGEKAGEHGD